jgi:succinoglycan biosynthesis protein ExoA
MSRPIVSVIIPCRNEARFIGACLDSILASDYPAARREIIVADGLSDDGTREELAAYLSRGLIRVVDNPGRIVSTGLNRAIHAARGEIIIRVDAHTEYAPDYLRQCVEVLTETGAANVGGAQRTRSDGYLQGAIAAAFHSPFAVGGARSHDVEHEGFVDSVIYGCWRRETLLAIGLFDEALVRNQDDELNLRLTRAGYRIYQSRRIRSWYRPRASLGGLFRQYRQYGYWKVAVIRKHRLPASWRHLVPAAWVAGLGGLLLLAPVNALAAMVLIGTLVTYGVAALLAALAAPRRYLPLLPVIFFIYHFAYGTGFLRGVIDQLRPRQERTTQFTRLSR